MASPEKAVVFDLDGTVLDTIGNLASALNRAVTASGYASRTVSEVKSFLGNGSLMLIRRAIGGGSDAECRKIRERFREEYEKDMFSLTSPYEGMAELLCELSSSGIKTAVVTNKDHKCALPIIEHFFGKSVDICRGVKEDFERKPNPALTLGVLEALGVAPKQALFVGDGLPDLNVSRNAGIDFIPVGYGYTDPAILYKECGTVPCADVASLREELLRRLR